MYKIFGKEEWWRLYELPGFLYEIYLTSVLECQVEELIFDLAEFCDKNDCSIERVFENDFKAAFQLVSIANSLAAVTFAKFTDDIKMESDAYFEMWMEIGKNLGKLVRLSTSFTEDGLFKDESSM